MSSLVLCLIAAVVTTPSAADLLKKADAAESFNAYYAQMQQTITTTGGEQRTLVMRGWAVRNGEKQLMEYLAPADIKGQRILMTHDGDDIWMYNAETRRTRKLGSHMRKRKVMDSDFTYEDQAGGKLSEKYTGKVLREEEQGGAPCWVLELTPTPVGPSYAKVVAWIGEADGVTRRIDFYEDGGGEPFKRLVMSNIHTVSGKIVPFRMEMTNLVDGGKTSTVITKIQYGARIPESIFESRNLGQ